MGLSIRDIAYTCQGIYRRGDRRPEAACRFRDATFDAYGRPTTRTFMAMRRLSTVYASGAIVNTYHGVGERCPDCGFTIFRSHSTGTAPARARTSLAHPVI